MWVLLGFSGQWQAETWVRGGFQEGREKLEVAQVQALASSGHVAPGLVVETNSTDLGTESSRRALRKGCPLLWAESCPPNLYMETPTPNMPLFENKAT